MFVCLLVCVLIVAWCVLCVVCYLWETKLGQPRAVFMNGKICPSGGTRSITISFECGVQVKLVEVKDEAYNNHNKQ